MNAQGVMQQPVQGATPQPQQGVMRPPQQGPWTPPPGLLPIPQQLVSDPQRMWNLQNPNNPIPAATHSITATGRAFTDGD